METDKIIELLRCTATFDNAEDLYEEFGVTYSEVIAWLDMQKSRAMPRQKTAYINGRKVETR